MTRRVTVFCVVSLVLVCIVGTAAGAATNALTPTEKAAGWKLLFDGKTFDGWRATGNPKGWTTEDRAIVNLAKGGGYLVTDDQFDDFVLSLEFKLDKGVNSGVFFRWADLRDPVQTGIEMQILDSYGREKPGRHDCGAIYDCLAPTKNACKPAGEWDKLRLTCRDNLIWIDMNGKRIVYMNLDKWTTARQNLDGSGNKFNTAYKDMPRKGYIGLQDHGGKIWFRNIKIKPLKASKD